MSYSQLNQDVWVLEKLNFKSNGYFVEAGACDGVLLSNTLLLEQKYNWSGICCEPNKEYYEKLVLNRKCQKSDLLLYDTDNEKIDFYAANELGGTYEDFKDEQGRVEIRKKFNKYHVNTITLNTLLYNFNSPKTIDYISLDTEGSELKILSNFNFSFWDVKIFSVEHNTHTRNDKGMYLKKIIDLMKFNKYNFKINEWDCFFYK